MDLRPLVSPNVPANHPVSPVATTGIVASKRKAVSTGKSPNTRKELAPIFCKVRLKQPPPAGVDKKASSLRSKSPSVALSAGARYARRAVSSSTYVFGADREEELVFIPNASKSGDSDQKSSFDHRYFSMVLFFQTSCALVMYRPYWLLSLFPLSKFSINFTFIRSMLHSRLPLWPY